MEILSKNEEDQVIDVLREGNKGKSPITFGDVGIDENGQEYPLETVMVKVEDHYSK